MATDTASTVHMPRDRAFFLDPTPWYRRMRQDHPVWRDPATGGVMVFRHADVMTVLGTPEVFSSRVCPRPRATPCSRRR